MEAEPNNELFLEVGGRQWPLDEGDIIGRMGSVAVEALKAYDALSRKHLRVGRIHEFWNLTVLPNARNKTYLNGQLMVADEAVPLRPYNQVRVDNLVMTFRQTTGSAQPAKHVEVPAALIKLDALFKLREANGLARDLLGSLVSLDEDLLLAVDAESRARLRLSLQDMKDYEDSDPLELAFPTGNATRWITARFRSHEQGYLGAIHESTAAHLHRTAMAGSDEQTIRRSDALITFLNSNAFRTGDLPAALTLLAHQAAALLSETAVSIWLPAGAGQDGWQRAAAAGFPQGTRLQTLVAVPPRVGPALEETSDWALDEETRLKVISPHAQEVVVQKKHGALLICEWLGHDEWPQAQRRLVSLVATLFDQALANAEKAEFNQRLQAREASLNQELAAAARYMTRLLPAPVSEGPVQVDWRHRPSGGIGGDVFGYEWLDAEHFALYVMDVAGHGTGAALFAVSLINTLRLWMAHKESWLTDPAAWLQEFNEAYPMEKNGGMTWTMWCGVYHRGRRELTFASAGHPPAVLAQQGRCRELTTEGPVLGVLQDMKFRAARINLLPGAKLYVYTDGAYEFPLADGSTGTNAAFISAIEGTAGMSGGECDYLLQHGATLCGSNEFPDDYTVLRARFEG